MSVFHFAVDVLYIVRAPHQNSITTEIIKINICPFLSGGKTSASEQQELPDNQTVSIQSVVEIPGTQTMTIINHCGHKKLSHVCTHSGN